MCEECSYPGELAQQEPEPDDAAADPFGGHEFCYESHTDLFRCAKCRVYEVTARKDDAITPRLAAGGEA